MKSHMKLTDSVVNSLPLVSSDSERRFVHDLGLTGLSLQISKQKKSWYVYKTFRKKPLKFKLGEFPVMRSDEARSEAIKVLSDLTKGIHPQEARRKAENAVVCVGALFERYLLDHLKPHTRAWANTEKCFRRHAVSILDRELLHLTRNEIQRWVNALGETAGKQTADRSFNTLRACIRWGAKNDLCRLDPDPTLFIKLFKVQPKKEILHQSDWRKIKPVLDAQVEVVRDIIYMLLFTAARKSNVLMMEWSEIHLSTKIWTIPAEKMKNGKETDIPLTDDAIAILEKRRFLTKQIGYVFPSETGAGHYANIDRPWRKIRALAGVSERLTIHSLRHTLCSWMGMTGANSFQIKDAAGHSSIATTMGYTHLQKDSIRNAMKKASDALREDEHLSA